ncbi:MAG TPA: hypothetical protein VIB98_04725 [Gemmatimonadaceae bacterium]|jgi:hypothetical protein
MKPLDQLKFTILVIAIAIWAWGARSGNRGFMYAGICFVIVAFLLRFLPRAREGDAAENDDIEHE